MHFNLKPGLLVPLLLGAVMGPALQIQQAQLWPLPVYVGLCVAAVCLLWWARQRHRRHAGALTVLAVWAASMVLAGAVAGWRAHAFEATRLNPNLEGLDIALVGVVAAMPQSHEFGLRFRLTVEQASVKGVAVKLPPLVLLSWYAAAAPNEAPRALPNLRAGERWKLNVRLKAPQGNLNPHGFDYELWLWEQGVQATGYVRINPKLSPPRHVASTGLHPIESARQTVRDAIYARVADRRQAGVLAALVTGDQNAIDRADWDVFRATGVAHLMSISGLHVTMFAWLAAALVGWLWQRSPRTCMVWPSQHAALVGGLILSLAYALFSGMGVPAQRTLWMLATIGLLRWSGRQWPWPMVWLLAAAVVVTVDPWALLQVGFWLSFVAVGVLFATHMEVSTTGTQRGYGRVVALLREQWVVTVALTPLTLLLFGQASVVGLLANLLAIPWVTLLVTPLALAGTVLVPTWDLAAWAVGVLGWWLEWLAALPGATVSLAAAPWWIGAAAVGGALLLVMRVPWSLRLAGVPLVLPLLMWQPLRPDLGQFELLAADVGQGNAVVVRTAHHTMVYDAGPSYGRDVDAGHRVLVPLLRAWDESLDMLMLSHRDLDHVGGAPAVLAMQPKAALWASIEPTHPLQALRQATRCEAGQSWVWDGVQFAILHPLAADYERPPKPNGLSCVLRISSAAGVDPQAPGGRVALLVGDIERPQEKALLARGADLRADFLLVPHHGSKTSSTAPFLDAVQPVLAVAQTGYRNRFGHPAPEVVARYLARGIQFRDSVPCGAFAWRSDAAHHADCLRQSARRYWHHALPHGEAAAGQSDPPTAD